MRSELSSHEFIEFEMYNELTDVHQTITGVNYRTFDKTNYWETPGVVEKTEKFRFKRLGLYTFLYRGHLGSRPGEIIKLKKTIITNKRKGDGKNIATTLTLKCRNLSSRGNTLKEIEDGTEARKAEPGYSTVCGCVVLEIIKIYPIKRVPTTARPKHAPEEDDVIDSGRSKRPKSVFA